MKIQHVALYTNDLERLKNFYVTKFQARPNALYHNQKTGFKSYFLSFDDDCKLELMTRPELEGQQSAPVHCGYSHLALTVGNSDAVDTLTAQLKNNGVSVISGPRTTGDGYYESCVLDPDGNQIELVAAKE